MDALDDKQLKDQVQRGTEITDLAKHPGFILIMDLLKRDADEAIEQLKIEEDMKKVKNFQNIIWRHDELASKMYTMIAMGHEALQELIDGGVANE